MGIDGDEMKCEGIFFRPFFGRSVSKFHLGVMHGNVEKMRDALRQKVVAICDEKIAKKGADVGLSFYAFFANKNDNPELLMEAAEWWIRENKLDHFEKAAKIKEMVQKTIKI